VDSRESDRLLVPLLDHRAPFLTECCYWIRGQDRVTCMSRLKCAAEPVDGKEGAKL
jgi:hypothetical protein